jgi:Type II secretory pathway, component PulF
MATNRQAQTDIPKTKNAQPGKIGKAPKKSVFLWTYKDPEKKGAVQTGEIEAVSVTTAKVALRQRGFRDRYLTLTKQKESLFGGIKSADIVGFLQQLSTLQNAGVSIVESMQMLRLTAKKTAMRSMIQKMMRNLQEGNQLSDALALFPNTLMQPASPWYAPVNKAASWIRYYGISPSTGKKITASRKKSVPH